MKKLILITSCMIISSVAMASEGGHHDMSGHQIKQHAKHEQMNKMQDVPSHMFLVKKQVDGYEVTFHIMPATKSMSHSGSHNVMVKVEKDGKELSDVMVNSKVFFPNKTTDSKMLMLMNGWFMNGYDMGEGTHGVMILFKTADGKKHKASVYYPEDK